MNAINFLIVGVGGQGILLAGDVLCQVGLAAGYNVKKTDAHGMSQRGGSVVSHVRFGEQVLSPVVPAGQADYLLALERLEAARWIGQLRPQGTAVVNDEAIPTLAAFSASPRRPDRGGPQYPSLETVTGLLKQRAGRVMFVPAGQAAADLGNHRVANVVLLGALSTVLDIPVDAWHAALLERVPARFLDVNVRAFAAGREALDPTSGGYRRLADSVAAGRPDRHCQPPTDP